MNTTGLVIVIAVVAVAFVAVVFYVTNRSKRLRSKFGPEYNRAVQETGSKYRAESKLEKLERRVERLSIQPLSADAADRFRDSWRAIQAEFVDDRLLAEVMTTRGYPVSDFEERAAEISVNHPLVVENYRAGHEIALRHAQEQASTEDMRQAMIHYRTLFDDLLGTTETARAKAAGSSK
jgi:hypothetical protein